MAGIRSIDETDDIFLISDDGIIIRIGASEITMQSRYGGGVRVMRLAEGSKLVTLARAPSEEANGDEEESEAESNEAEETREVLEISQPEEASEE